jgi:radical SAM superfamily enzyme YgiQ (UPF0313 family)
MDEKARYRYRADSVLPMSDHAGFDDLERYVEESGARKVYTLYGDHYFASHLRRRGIDAEHLHPISREASIPASRKKKSDELTLNLFETV